MKTFFSLVMAISFVYFCVCDSKKQKNKTRLLDEVVRFVGFVKSELNYRNSDYESLYEISRGEGYKYITFENKKIGLDGCAEDKVSAEFSAFIQKIGTTDGEGQLSMCDEYRERFADILNVQRQKEKEKLRVNTAVSVMGALSVFIFFL